MELAAILKDKLNVGDNVVAFHEGIISQGLSSKAHRLLALVERNSAYGLFIFTTSRNPPQAFTDLTINFVVPIDENFNCDIEPAESNSVYINILAKNLKLYIRMDPGKETNNFFTELSKAMDLYLKKVQTLDFHWLDKYNINDINIELGLTMSINGENTKANGTPNNKLPLPMASRVQEFKSSRESIIERQKFLYEGKYTEEKNFIVYIGTWNVNGQSASSPLDNWLIIDSEPPDIYAIGFQELDLSKEAYLFNDSPREEEWLLAVTKCLKSKEYHQVALVRLVGMMIIVFVQHKHEKYVTNVCTDSVGTGILGKLGNKGGVAIRMDFHNTSMCFVNTHLAAHVEEYERRNQDYHNICSRVVFPNCNITKTIKDHNQVYWFGDLNYRITEMDALTVKRLVSLNDFENVLKADQLKQQHRAGRVFEGYKEGPINFLPTYKYDTGTSDWDSSEKNRAPAWCDRILWRGSSIKQLAYRSHPKLLISDHKPVSALFKSKVKVVDEKKERQIIEYIMKELDKAENEYLPQVMVDSTEIVFNNVQFMEPQIKELTVANTGQVPVQFKFINKLEDTTYCKEWLQIQPFTSFIEPGAKCDIALEVLVDKRSAYKMNSGQDKLNNILILHLEGGKDIFITVTGTYEPSCFGCSLETLCYLKVPIKDITYQRLVELESNNSNLNSDPYPVPKEIWYLVDHLYRYGLKEENLFEQSGLGTEFIQIRNWLDNGSPAALPGSVHTVAEALLILLDSTSEPIIPYNFHQACLSASSYDQCIKIISNLPEQRKNVFVYLCAFLQELTNHVKDNSIDIKTIASVFGEIFIRDPPKSRSNKSGHIRTPMSRKKTNFVYYFLVNDQSDLISTAV